MPAVDINVVNPNPTVAIKEGNDAKATYTFSALNAGADVNISANGWGADATDFVNSAFYYRVKSAGSFDTTTPVTSWTRVLTGLDGQIHLNAGVNGLQLGVSLEKDGVTEYSEAVNFVVQQMPDSVALKDSWWESTTIKIADAATQGVFTGGVGPDILVGTSGVDVFVVPDGTSRALAGQFDTITLGTGDKIDLDLNDDIGDIFRTSTNVEGDVLSAILQKSQTVDGFDAKSVLIYNVGTDAYLMVDTNANGNVDIATDVFVKIVGGSTLVLADIPGYLV